MTKFVSWNVNGFRACLQKGFADFFAAADADFFCLQETKMQEGQADFAPPGYHSWWNSALKKGYSGTAVFARREPVAVSTGIGGAPDSEGRVLTLEYPEFYLVNCYSPNAQEGLKRLGVRMEFEDGMRGYLAGLSAQRPVVYCGDLNVAHEEIDLKNPKPNRGAAGFSDEERGKMTELLAAGFTDTFRFCNPGAAGMYSWWSYRYHARATNAGWRIDYFLVSDRVRDRIADTPIYSEIQGSDHCPVGLTIEL